MKTSDSYQKEILEKYKKGRGGKMQGYLIEPTQKQIREACIWLIDKRNAKYDPYILNRFFQFKDETDRVREIQKMPAGKFKPIVNFLKGNVKRTRPENIELISWLIDFRPRPLHEYLKLDVCISTEVPFQTNDDYTKIVPKGIADSELEPGKKREVSNIGKGPVTGKWLKISISITFCAVLLTMFYFRNGDGNKQATPLEGCMTWVKTHYEEVSCSTKPSLVNGMDVVPYEETKVLNFKKVKVTMATDFFVEGTDKPLIWYFKTKEGEIEYFTSPGLHPTTGETLRKITPYIIQTYVPMHQDKKESFVQ